MVYIILSNVKIYSHSFSINQHIVIDQLSLIGYFNMHLLPWPAQRLSPCIWSDGRLCKHVVRLLKASQSQPPLFWFVYNR